MVTRSKARFLAAAIWLPMLTAACGTSSQRSTSRSSGRSATVATVGSTTGRDGTYLTDGSGRALYMWVGDDSGKSNCDADCVTAWPPLVTGASPRATGGATSAALGTLTRDDAGRQVTYKGHPLYYFAADTGPGTTKGQGSNSFGARWWLVAPSGAAITKNASSSVAPPVGY